MEPGKKKQPIRLPLLSRGVDGSIPHADSNIDVHRDVPQMGNTLQEDARSGGHHHQIRQFGITSQVSITVMNKQTFFNLFEFEIVYSGGQLFVPSHNCHIYRKR